MTKETTIECLGIGTDQNVGRVFFRYSNPYGGDPAVRAVPGIFVTSDETNPAAPFVLDLDATELRAEEVGRGVLNKMRIAHENKQCKEAMAIDPEVIAPGLPVYTPPSEENSEE